jgi:coenzyme PQQ precursor peptide PqqA
MQLVAAASIDLMFVARTYWFDRKIERRNAITSFAGEKGLARAFGLVADRRQHFPERCVMRVRGFVPLTGFRSFVRMRKEPAPTLRIGAPHYAAIVGRQVRACAKVAAVLSFTNCGARRKHQWEDVMAWKTPKIVEVAVGMEINMYACAARK